MPDHVQAAGNQQTRLADRYRKAAPGVGAWNPVIDLLLAHCSVRSYRTDALPDGTVETLVAAAQSAATSSNLQTWSVLAVEDPDRRFRLSEFANNQKHIVQAPLFLIWLADLSRAARLGAAMDREMEAVSYMETFLVSVIDAALAAQNAVIAAESLGLGTVYIGALRNHPVAVAKELGLPPGVLATFGLCVGYADPEAPASVKPRLPQSVVLHREQYSASAESADIPAYDDALRAFQAEQSMPLQGWQELVANRLGTLKGMSGRHLLKDALGQLGFGLR